MYMYVRITGHLRGIKERVRDALRYKFEARKDSVRKEVRCILGIDRYMDSLVHKKPILGKVRRYDGYTVQNICIETLPGEHVFGSIYTPAKKGKHPLIICPDGHFGGGRYRADEQQRLGTLARMGAICVDFDLYGWGQSKTEYGKNSHQTDRAAWFRYHEHPSGRNGNHRYDIRLSSISRSPA